MTAAPTDLSRAIGITTAGMTNLLDRLEAEGFVRRERHPSDGRRLSLSLTKKGLRTYLELEQASEPALHAFERLGAADQANVLAFLRDAAASLEAVDAAADAEAGN